MNFLRNLVSTGRGRAILAAVVVVVVLIAVGAFAALRDNPHSSWAGPQTEVTAPLDSLAVQPAGRWTLMPEPGVNVVGPVGGDAERVLYAAKVTDGPLRLLVVNAETGERQHAVDLAAESTAPECWVRGDAALCAVAAPVPELLFLDLAAGSITARTDVAPTGTGFHGYPVGEGFLVWSDTAAPALYRPDGSVKWQAQGSAFMVSPAAPVVYALDLADQKGRVLSADDGHLLVEIAVLGDQPVRFQAFAGGFALERPGDQIRFFAVDGQPMSGAVSAAGGQRLAAAVDVGRSAVTSVPVLLETRDSGVTVVAADPGNKENLWKQQVPQADPEKIRIAGVGTQVVIDDGANHCFAFSAATGDGGAIGCGQLLGTDGQRILIATPSPHQTLLPESDLAAFSPGDTIALWSTPVRSAAVFGGGIYGVDGRLR
ncbi:MAG: hypothetical protein WAW85_09930 [Gordonia sp. (in: high G+C Gram-positive bacteria)]|uniref:hypothetical protein n=1 Tax=Gordonia sp. (in: high G+C Gram-positive bacteria) TaxID=84139 RepID=UPI003BB5C12B